MQVFHGLDEVPASLGRTAVSVGNFDGVHCGHRLILDGVCQARQHGLRPVVVLFDPHPLRILRPTASIKLITPLPFRLEFLAAAGIDSVLVLPFTPELSHMSARDFASRILSAGLSAIEVHEGANFRFGHRAEGGIEELRQLGCSLGFRVVSHPAAQVGKWTVSSTRIREAVSQGNIRLARRLLGRNFSLRSAPAAGHGIGSRLTVPTINLAPYAELLPANGVYVTRLSIGGKWWDGVTNVGNRPTFGGESLTVETHLLDFRPLQLTSETEVELQFHYKIRGERRWPSPEALKEQILLDAAFARRYHRLHRLLNRAGSVPGK